MASEQPQPHAKLMSGHENVSQSMFLTSRSLYSGKKRLTAPMSYRRAKSCMKLTETKNE